MLEIRLLGQFELRRDGEIIKLASRKAQSLLAYLLLNKGMTHRREQIAGLLWPDVEESEARGKLRYTLWQLRQKIGDAYISADKISLAFNDGAYYWLDASALEAGDREADSIAALTRGLSAYRGELLPGFYEEWVVLERERLRAIHERHIHALLRRLIDAQDWPLVLKWAERWISFGQAPEPAYRALMIAFAHMGDISSAVSAYQRCVDALREGLAVDPSEETRRLYDQVLNGEMPEALYEGHPAAPSEAALHPPDVAPPLDLDQDIEAVEPPLFVARGRELEYLNAHLLRALEGEGGVAFLRGGGGAGKTALLREFRRRAMRDHDELTVAYGSGEAHTGLGDPHLLFRDVLGLLTGDVQGPLAEGKLSSQGARRLWSLLPQSVGALLELGPDLIDSFVSGPALLRRAANHASSSGDWRVGLERLVDAHKGLPQPINIQHRDLQKALFDQYTHTLLRLSGYHPLLIVLDDLQWADLGSVSLLFHFGRRLPGHRILVLGAYRPDDLIPGEDSRPNPLSRVLTEFRRQFGEIERDLDGIGETERRAFVDAILDTEPNRLDEGFRMALYRHTGGHALFTVELLRQLQAEGDIQKDAEGFWVQHGRLVWEDLPPRIEAVIEDRISPLPEHLLEMLRIASVEGEEFSAEVIAAGMDMDVTAVIRRLSHELGERHSLISAVGIQRVGDERLSRYRFRHHLFHSYVYHSLDPIVSAHLHQQVGETLEGIYRQQRGEIVHRLAKYFQGAGAPEKAIDYLLQAAERAKRQSANEEAINHLRSGLSLLQDLPDEGSRAGRELALRIAISAPLVATQGYTAPEVEVMLERARALCDRVRNPTQLATTLWGLWSYYLVRAKHQVAKELAGEIQILSAREAIPTLDLVAHWTLGISEVHLGEFTSARQNLQRAISQYDPEQHNLLTYLYGQNPAATCRIYSAFNLWCLGYPDQASEMCRSALKAAGGIGHPFSLAFVHAMAALFYALLRDRESAYQHAQQAVSLSRESGFPFLLTMGLTTRGWARAAMGKSSMTIRPMIAGIEAMDDIGSELGRPIFLFLLAETYAELGKVEASLEAIDRALGYAHQNLEHLNLADLLRFKAEQLLALGGPKAEVMACYSDALAVARKQDAKWLQLRVLSSMVKFLDVGRAAVDARGELAALLPSLSEGRGSADWTRARELLDRHDQGP